MYSSGLLILNHFQNETLCLIGLLKKNNTMLLYLVCIFSGNFKAFLSEFAVHSSVFCSLPSGIEHFRLLSDILHCY